MNNYLIMLPIILPILVGLFIGVSSIEDVKTIRWTSAIAVILNTIALIPILGSNQQLDLININGMLSISFRADEITKIFTLFISCIWIFVTFYSFEYMSHEGGEKRFFAFMTATLGAVIGLGFAKNLFTMYLMYEGMTLLSFPLVMHSLSKDAIKAGIKYIAYSLTGGALVLLSIFVLYHNAPTLDFTPGGVLDIAKLGSKTNTMLIFYALAFFGFGSKAGMFPLHAWLPTAHPVAPSPASALLSGIITKAGVLGIIRMTFYIFGAKLIKGTWVQTFLIATTLITVFMGSMLAFRRKS